MTLQLSGLDWGIIAGFLVLSLLIGLLVSRRASQSYSEFFLSGRNMPWWLLGVSMVATTFSADTPNLVTDIVRKDGVAGNWQWWAFLLTGMLTVFVYAKLWRRSGILTDLEFYELRYSGKPAAFLRGFRAIYLGVFFNCVIMATVILAGIKIGGVLGLSRTETVLIASVVTVLYTSLGGLRGVLLTDFFQFILAMVGTVGAAIVVVNHPKIGGLDTMLAHPNVSGSLDLLPDFNDPTTLIPLFLIPIAVQWWSVWYPGAEPGGGGYIVQRMLSAKDEKNAVGATLLFNIAHYALRPWPWILIALASLIIFPDHASLSEAFPHLSEKVINDDLAYPAMLGLLPKGLLGIVLASLLAAFMSTISTHLNWGSSYLVHDVYKRFVRPEAENRELVNLGRLITLTLMVLAVILAFYLESALDGFQVLLQIGAGTGLLFILRWFWWRINAYSELTAMVVSFVIALYFEIAEPDLLAWERLLWGVGITTASWVLVTFLTPAADRSTLIQFYKLIRPHQVGWRPVVQEGQQRGVLTAQDLPTGRLPIELACMLIGSITVYAALFATGYWIYGNVMPGVVASSVTILGGLLLMRLYRQIV
jgi:SSS family solute:Na+ symporter